MRLCRFEGSQATEIAVYAPQRIYPLARLAQHAGHQLEEPLSSDLMDYLPPNGRMLTFARDMSKVADSLNGSDFAAIGIPTEEAQLMVPIGAPAKVILLAGNYADHVKEGGDRAEERDRTFPYFFWKPPSTTLTHPRRPIRIPEVSPDHVDWEIELAVIIGKSCRGVSEEQAGSCIAGCSVCVDVSDRKYQINPDRAPRDRDRFFDWLHGKWHDTFLPMGPCALAAGPGIDFQNLKMTLKVNDEVMQQGSTAQMIFPIAAVISTLSQSVTLEPGDIICTGTPAGVGAARNPPRFLSRGDVVHAEIEKIGSLENPVE